MTDRQLWIALTLFGVVLFLLLSGFHQGTVQTCTPGAGVQSCQDVTGR